jgi:hypothetical protein
MGMVVGKATGGEEGFLIAAAAKWEHGHRTFARAIEPP